MEGTARSWRDEAMFGIVDAVIFRNLGGRQMLTTNHRLLTDQEEQAFGLATVWTVLQDEQEAQLRLCPSNILSWLPANGAVSL